MSKTGAVQSRWPTIHGHPARFTSLAEEGAPDHLTGFFGPGYGSLGWVLILAFPPTPAIMRPAYPPASGWRRRWGERRSLRTPPTASGPRTQGDKPFMRFIP